jgi:HlyD family secretion protein
MAEKQAKKRTAWIRPVVFLAVLATAGYFIWRYSTRAEGYTGGEVATTGTVEAVHVQLGFKVGGRLASVDVSEGANVASGQVVARLETADLDLAVVDARGMLESARAALESAHGGLEAARAALAESEATRDRAARDLERQQELVKTEATTAQQADDARAAARVADAQVLARTAQLRQAESAVRQAESAVHQAESAVREAELRRSYAELKTVEPGTVSDKVHQPGEMVAVGTPVVTVSQMDTVKVLAAVDETRVGAVRPGDAVKVRVYTFDDRWFDGRVTDIQPAGDFATRKDWGAQRRDIRTFTVTARVPNPDHLLKDGMTADVRIQAQPPARPVAEARR